MATLDHLKSVISIGNVDHTSLALPSSNQCRSGQQRVREQVETLRRSKTRLSSSRSASTSLSPTSPTIDSVFREAPKLNSSTSNGGFFFPNGYSKTHSREPNFSLYTNNIQGASVKRTVGSTYQHVRSFAGISSTARGQANTSHSEPGMAWNRSAPPQGFPSSRAIYREERSSGHFVKTPTSPLQFQPVFTMNGTGQTKSSNQFLCSEVEVTKTATDGPAETKANTGSDTANITMKEAVEYLSSAEETYQHCGASYIQHNTFITEEAKDEVLKFKGIHPLVDLLRSQSSQVNETSSAALRNLSFKSISNKEEIHRSGGITEAVALLRETDSVETQTQLTGLLWNLSSVDSLKPDLLKSALPVLMERVILPYSKGHDRTSGSSRDPEVFFNATACLRNLSSTKQSNRQAMRKCRGLVDSLVSYVKECVDAGNPDDKSVENCVCILHNLTFQLEAEAPALFSRITALAKTVCRTSSEGDTGPIGCFSPQKESSEHQRRFDYPVVEDPQPNGAGFLIHSSTLQNYLSLLATSQREETQEACCGALQNLTTNDGIVSSVMSQNIVQKLKGLHVISPLIKSPKVNIQRNTVALVGNLTKNPNLHIAIVHKALPELLGILSAGTKEGNESDDTLSMACQTSNCLLMNKPEMGKHLVNSTLISSLNDLSKNTHLPKSSKSASVLLYNLWSDKDLQGFLKKSCCQADDTNSCN
ncbi:plakophilin-1 isoform X2 [Pseudochaenichthys georgianus]|uniref:plakophilin-1 isoform X2 n=1 Tax=Pseudochaenichthys georgianus TaxID=52239 RepID=UPI00146F095F|nr:plakophilin-1 isoform X2 [Pseudochaenichthys georgianus]